MSERMPERIQRKRTKGWRMPEGAVYVGRPSRWGNPFAVGSDAFKGQVPNADWAVSYFRDWMLRPHQWCLPMPPDLSELRGKDLVCWCPLDAPCHADVLLQLANPAPAVPQEDHMSALTDRITELLVDHTFVPGDDETPGECTSSACLWKGWFLGDWRRHVAERLEAELQLTEERGWTRCSDRQCGDSTWDHDCDEKPRTRWVSAWSEVQP